MAATGGYKSDSSKKLAIVNTDSTEIIFSVLFLFTYVEMKRYLNEMV